MSDVDDIVRAAGGRIGVSVQEMMEAIDRGDAGTLEMVCPSCGLACVALLRRAPNSVDGKKQYQLDALHMRPGCDFAKSGSLLRWMQSQLTGHGSTA